MNRLKKVLKRWYLPLFAGMLYILCGVWAIAVPAGSFISLILFISVGILISGTLELFHSLINQKNTKNWGWEFSGGILSILIGFLLLTNIQLTLSLFSVFIGIWILLRSFFILAHALNIKRKGEKRWAWLLIAAGIGIAFSAILLSNPVFLGTLVGVWIGISLLLIGFVHILISLFLHKINKIHKPSVDKTGDYIVISSRLNSP